MSPARPDGFRHCPDGEDRPARAGLHPRIAGPTYARNTTTGHPRGIGDAGPTHTTLRILETR